MGNADKNLCILVLSAYKEHAETIIKSLQKLDFTKLQVMDNGIEALKKITDQNFGFLICDQNIRFISGWLLIKEIKNSDKIPNLPAILFGKDAQPDTDEMLQRYGLVKYLQFPINPGQLDFIINSTLLLFNTSGTVENKYSKAKDSLLENKPSEAIELYSELRSLTKNSPRSSVGLAQAFKQNDQDDKAEKVMEELAHSDEKSPASAIVEAKMLLQKQQVDLALATLKHILTNIPNGFYFTKAIRLLMDHQLFSLAAPLCLQAIAADIHRPEYLLCLAKDRYSNQDIEATLDFIKQHEAAFGMTSELYNLCGVCYKKQGHPDRAIKAYEQALRLSPTDARVYFNLAMCVIPMKRNEEAAHYLELCLQYSPGFPKAQEKLDELRKRIA